MSLLSKAKSCGGGAPMTKDYNDQVNQRAEAIKAKHRDPVQTSLAQKIKQIKQRYNPVKQSSDALNKQQNPAADLAAAKANQPTALDNTQATVPGASAAMAGGLLRKAKRWQVPGLVPPKHPEIDLHKHVPGVSDEKFDSCVSQVKRKGTGNAYAICTASLKKNNDDYGYESRKAATDALATKSGKPTLLHSHDEDDGSTFQVLMATRPEHANMIGVHHHSDTVPGKDPLTWPSDLHRAVEDAQSKGFDRLIVHPPAQPGAKKQVGHLSVMKSENLDKATAKGKRRRSLALLLQAAKASVKRGLHKGEPPQPPKPPKAPTLAKDDQPHPAGSPEDSAHDVVEEGKPLGQAISEHLKDGKISAMLRHLRNSAKEPDWQRSKENQAFGAGN